MNPAANQDSNPPFSGKTHEGKVREVLVVDDSKMQRKILSAILRRWGYDVLEAESGSEALDICRKAHPDVILSDWMMPGMTGIEFCEAYRALGQEQYGYFILLTSRAEKTDVAQGLERGADDFLTKPVNAAELKGRILAGERILSMQAVVNERNRQLNETLSKLQSMYRALDRDLDEARRLQQSLVPERHRVFSGGEASLLLRPSGHVGGDLVGMFRVSDTRLGLFGIDVAGHGIASALMTARLAGYLSGTAADQNVALKVDAAGSLTMRPPHEVCGILNRLITADTETDHYFTMLLADCDLKTGRVVMSQAGHPNPLLIRHDGSMEFVGTGGMPIGLIEAADYSDFEIQLAHGDRLLIHSDGFTECPSPDETMLGDDGLIDLATSNRGLAGPDFLEGMVWQLAEFAGGEDFPDDVSAALLDRPVNSNQNP
jgi:sigma-B regulation protein RsbU (phosphoserine phosphatase)